MPYQGRTSHATQTRSSRVQLALSAAAVTLIAAWLHAGGLNDVIAWDEAHYILAAKEGVFANAWEMGELNAVGRHWHGPLMCYFISASTAVFGDTEWAARLPAVLFAAMTCGLLVLAGFDLARGHGRTSRLVAGAAAGLLMATAPASIELAGVIQPHSFVIFFMVLNIWTLARYLRDRDQADALLFGLSLAGQFLVMEYGPVILFFALLAVSLTHPDLLGLRRSRPWIIRSSRRWLPAVHRNIWFAASACVTTIVLLWPAGIFRAGAILNFAYYLLYAAHGHPIMFRGQMHDHVPKYAYAWWYGQSYPLLLIGLVVALALIVAWAWRKRDAVAVTLAVFAISLTAVVHASHIMMLSKSVFMIPAIALGGPLAALWWIPERAGSKQFPWRSIALSGVAFAAIIGGQLTPISRRDDANRHLAALCQTLAQQAEPGDDVLAQGWPMVRYLLQVKHGRDDVRIHRYDPRNFESDQLGPRLDGGQFAWAITIGPTASAYPECPALKQMHERWVVVDDHSQPLREYRLYRAPARPNTGELAHVAAAAGPESE